MSDFDAGQPSPSATQDSHPEAVPSASADLPSPAESSPPPPAAGLISSASAPSAGRVSQVWAESEGDDPDTDQASPADSGKKTARVELSAVEARVLGAMIEKSFLTPDVYPMTTNAMVTACNQKTNRDPVVSYTAVQIDSTLLELRQRELVRRVHTSGSRSTKHRQTLDEVLSLNSRQLALMSVLLLRGPQTIPELRMRTERHAVGFDDLDVVERTLAGMAGRSTPLVRELPRQSGQRENRWVHLIDDGEPGPNGETADAREAADAGASVIAAAPAATAVAPTAAAHEAGLESRVAELESQVAALRRQLRTLADKLGEPLD